jgi:NAD(P)-dependent dehydrogenase (short-subunit alcohol dehydrogenase family)
LQVQNFTPNIVLIIVLVTNKFIGVVRLGRLDGRVAVVTGGGDGIGAGIARRFAEEGARVVIAEMDEDRGRATAEELGSDTGVEARFVRTASVVRRTIPQ